MPGMRAGSRSRLSGCPVVAILCRLFCTMPCCLKHGWLSAAASKLVIQSQTQCSTALASAATATVHMRVHGAAACCCSGQSSRRCMRAWVKHVTSVHASVRMRAAHILWPSNTPALFRFAPTLNERHALPLATRLMRCLSFVSCTYTHQPAGRSLCGGHNSYRRLHTHGPTQTIKLTHAPVAQQACDPALVKQSRCAVVPHPHARHQQHVRAHLHARPR